jgi:hypothetical protein
MNQQLIEILFEKERDTKRTRRFSEAACKIKEEDNVGPASGTLYIQQWALQEAFGGTLPDAVVVTITRSEPAATEAPEPARPS